jgi:hypothetical protein
MTDRLPSSPRQRRMKNSRPDVELLQILSEVRLRERLDAVEDSFVSSHHPLQLERIEESLRYL